MLDMFLDNPILLYCIVVVICILIVLLVILIVKKVKITRERKKLKKTSDTILTEHYEEPVLSTLEEEINDLEEKVPVVENFEITEENKPFLVNKPIQIEINSELDSKNEKTDIAAILDKMQEDLTKRDEQEIYNFEKEQEETAIISYKELLKANGKEFQEEDNTKFDLKHFFDEDINKTYSFNQIELDQAEELSIITLDKNEKPPKLKINDNVKENTSIVVDKLDEKKEFKMSDFISPVYGKFESKLDYPTIPNYKQKKEKKISELEGDEFLEALKAFRQNL